jgi:hypothetical protein
MRKLSLILLVSVMAVTSALAQTRVKGIVKIAGSEDPLQGAKITLLQQNISSQTNAKGEFLLSYIESGDEEISISKQAHDEKTLILSTHHNRILPTAQPYGERTGLCLCLRIRNR